MTGAAPVHISPDRQQAYTVLPPGPFAVVRVLANMPLSQQTRYSASAVYETPSDGEGHMDGSPCATRIGSNVVVIAEMRPGAIDSTINVSRLVILIIMILLMER